MKDKIVNYKQLVFGKNVFINDGVKNCFIFQSIYDNMKTESSSLIKLQNGNLKVYHLKALPLQIYLILILAFTQKLNGGSKFLSKVYCDLLETRQSKFYSYK